MTPVRDLPMMFSGYPHALKRSLNFKRPPSNVFSKCWSEAILLLRLNENIFFAWWVARGEERKLGGLGRLVMGFEVKDGIFSEFFPLKHCGIHFSKWINFKSLLQISDWPTVHTSRSSINRTWSHFQNARGFCLIQT